ncbi:DUF1887 family CARF protein [Marinicella sp. S1101]|uniref:Card1-like endonuclease domain-containing protein n=1 Tax=Marinicella marina TaxID=2996016 RepID=UPI0022609508|nr:DUF1887 family CARF protein [Marinicella marina]MCX7554671.1 DUF1887 family CARF protein [Marinicella marina]MDJ1140736.1 DUF1887 family CARF protein [Marinicella marina]
MQIHLAIFHPKHAGILSAALTLGAEKVILLYHPQDDISGLKSAIQARGIKCEDGLIDFDTQLAREHFAQLIETHQQHDIIFNASSGYNKLVLLAFEQFTNFGYPVFLVDKFTDELHWLNEKHTHKDIHLSHEIKLKEYLKSFNTQIIDSGQTSPEDKASRELTQWIVSQLGQADRAIGSINYMAMSADINHRYTLQQNDFKNHHLQQLLDHFAAAGKLTIRGKKIKFTDDASRFYCNGGWLENHVFALLYGMRKQRPQLADLAKGMTVVRDQGKVRNEIDVAAICHNRLHIIECKTRRFGNSKADKSAANTAIYRLDTIKSLAGGHSGKAMLVSYQPLNKYTLSRAKDLGIYCCSHTQLKQLERHLFKFIDQTN